MAIQAQLYPSNSASPFWNNNNGYCASGLVDPHFNSQQKHHLQQQQQSQELYNGWRGAVDPNIHVHNPKALNSPTFALMLEKQWEETDRYINFQNEKLRYTLQEHWKQQVTALLKKAESRSLYVLAEKDKEIAQAAKRRVELEEYLRKLEAENREWQRVAKEKETMALTLYKTLEEMREGGYCTNGVVANDAVSFCDETRRNEEEATAENNVAECGGKRVGELEQITGVMVCKSCNSRRSCYLFLPCRHLSCCQVCNAFLDACPICRMPKKATIETLIF
ncbi:hypothetical protein RJT34_31810 [Clitoria ternatea]|uniref:RING-type domain-containing protein n=1 Tax=Clitoria ternatea TaxID=43366 RepID=A0AAN9I5A9_CLITE